MLKEGRINWKDCVVSTRVEYIDQIAKDDGCC